MVAVFTFVNCEVGNTVVVFSDASRHFGFFTRAVADFLHFANPATFGLGRLVIHLHEYNYTIVSAYDIIIMTDKVAHLGKGGDKMWQRKHYSIEELLPGGRDKLSVLSALRPYKRNYSTFVDVRDLEWAGGDGLRSTKKRKMRERCEKCRLCERYL